MVRRSALLLAALVALPGPVFGSHMSQYAQDPLQRDLQGQVHEPDGVLTRVLGLPLQNCVVELPVAGAFAGRCSPAAEAHGTGLQPHGPIAPGCTGADENGRPGRRVDGQCGLWEVGFRPLGLRPPFLGPKLDPGNIPPPLSERGMGSGSAPGRYAGAVRFLDARIDPSVVVAPSTPNGGASFVFAVVEYNRLLRDLAAGGMTPVSPGPSLRPLAPLDPLGAAILPGTHTVWAWYGQWDDRNGNGVVDHCFASCRTNPANGAGTNEFAWLGSCTDFLDSRVPEAVEAGTCIEDGNPNSDPPGAPCADPGAHDACAGTTMTMWIWPGNHHGNGVVLVNGGTFGDYPGRQVLSWIVQFPIPPDSLDPDVLEALSCANPAPTCDEIDRDWNSDPLLGTQNEVAPDGEYDDRTGDTRSGDYVRQWSGYTGGTSMYYGDDGLLVTLVHVTGVNCAPTGHGIGYDPGTCTFLDGDRYPATSPVVQGLLVGDGDGDPEHADGGLKGLARGAWVHVRESPSAVAQLPDPLLDP